MRNANFKISGSNITLPFYVLDRLLVAATHAVTIHNMSNTPSMEYEEIGRTSSEMCGSRQFMSELTGSMEAINFQLKTVEMPNNFDPDACYLIKKNSFKKPERRTAVLAGIKDNPVSSKTTEVLVTEEYTTFKIPCIMPVDNGATVTIQQVEDANVSAADIRETSSSEDSESEVLVFGNLASDKTDDMFDDEVTLELNKMFGNKQGHNNSDSGNTSQREEDNNNVEADHIAEAKQPSDFLFEEVEQSTDNENLKNILLKEPGTSLNNKLIADEYYTRKFYSDPEEEEIRAHDELYGSM